MSQHTTDLLQNIGIIALAIGVITNTVRTR